jgi:Sulfotransferase family
MSSTDRPGARRRIGAALRLMAGRRRGGDPPRSGTLELAAQEPAGDHASLAGLPFDANAFESRLVWIMGAPRTGSTWLLRLLIHPWILARGTPSGLRAPLPRRGRQLPDVVPIDESYLLHHLAPLRPLPGEPAEQPPPDAFVVNGDRRADPSYFFSDAFEGAWQPELRRLVLTRLHAQSQRAAREHGLADPLVLIKEPNGSHAAELAMSLLPRSRLIFLLRDGRDVIDSLLDARGAEAWIGAGNMDMSDPAERLAYVRLQARLWLNSTNAVQSAYAAHPEELRRTVRYEDLRAHTLEALRPLAAWLGLASDDAALRDAAEANAFEAIPRRLRGSGTPRRSATPGLWRENMTAAEQDAMEQIIGPKLRELGYVQTGK